MRLTAQLDRGTVVNVLRNALTAHLGEYKRPDGQLQPAIYEILNHDTDPPPPWKKIGLECLIFPPEPSSSLMFSGAVIRGVWDIRLIQHDRSTRVMDAYRAILAAGIPVTKQSYFRASDENDEQINLSLYSFEAITWQP